MRAKGGHDNDDGFGVEINEPPSSSSETRVDYIKGMAEKGRKFFVLLDVDRMMSDQNLAQVDAVG